MISPPLPGPMPAAVRSHWATVGHDENGDLDGFVCHCEIGEGHAVTPNHRCDNCGGDPLTCDCDES